MTTRFRSPLLLLAALLAVGLCCAAAWAAADSRRSSAQPQGLRSNVPGVYALVGGDVVVRPGEVVEDATLVVRDGKIEGIGADVKVPADATVIDVSGKRIYAGFIDAYAELPAEQTAKDATLADPAAANYWNPNVTPQVDAARILAVDAKAHEMIRKLGFVARVYAPGAGVIKGRLALVSTADGSGGDTLVLAENRGMAAQLLPAGRGRGAGYPSSPMGAFALVRQALYDAQWYSAARAAVEKDSALPLPERNDALAALAPVLDGEMPVWFVSRDEKYALRARKVADEFGLKAVNVASGMEYRRGELVADTKLPMVLPLNFPKPPDVSTPEQADAATLETLMMWDLAADNPRRMHDRGVKFALTLNGLRSERGVLPFWPNLKKSIDRGLPEDAALAALTTDAAEIIGVSDLLGTLEAGKLASFVVADGDLFKADGKAKVLETWTGGKRDFVARDPVVSFVGTWKLAVPQDAATRPMDALELSLRGKDRLSGTLTKAGGATTNPASRPAKEGSFEPLADAKAAADREMSVDAMQGMEKDAAATRAASRPATAPAEKADKLKNLKQTADRLTFTADAEPFGQSGVAVVSLTMVDGVASGVAVLPDGTRLPLTAQRTSRRPSSSRPTTRPAGNEIETDVPVEDEAATNAGEGEPTEVQTTPGGYAGGTTRTARPQPNETGDAATLETVATTGPTTVAAADAKKEAMYEPNFPLGAFGRGTEELPETKKVVIFSGATVWTSADAGVIENGTVVVEDGKIKFVGTADEAEQISTAYAKDDVTTVDCQGKSITPGMIDCHSHIASDSGINEGTQAVTAEVRLVDYIDPDDISIYRQLAGGTTMANTLHGSANPIGGQNAVVKFRWGVGPDQLLMKEAPQGVKFALGENVKQSNWGGEANSRYPQTRMGVPELVADEFRAAQDYQRAQADFKKNGGLPVRRDLELDAVVEILNGTRLIHCHSYRQDEILALLRVLESFHVKIASLQHILEGYKVAKEMKAHGATASTFSDWWAYKFEVYDAIPYNGAILHNAGVVVSFNSDDAELGRRLNKEAAKATKYGGVPPEEALKFVTINPAKQLHIDEFTGSLEPGKEADLAVWSGPPMSNKTRCLQTWVDGRKYFDIDEDAKMRDTVRQMRAALIQRILSSGEKPDAAGDGPPPRESQLWPRTDEYDD